MSRVRHPRPAGFPDRRTGPRPSLASLVPTAPYRPSDWRLPEPQHPQPRPTPFPGTPPPSSFPTRRSLLQTALGAAVSIAGAEQRAYSLGGLEKVAILLSKATQTDCEDPTAGLPSSITRYEQFLIPKDPTSGFPLYGYFRDMFGDPTKSHRYIVTSDGFLLKYEESTLTDVIYTGLSDPRGGALSPDGIILGAGTQIFEGHLNGDNWILDNIIDLATTGSITGLASAFYLNPGARTQGRDYTIFVAISPNAGIRRLLNAETGELGEIGFNSTGLESISVVEFNPPYCNPMIMGGFNSKVTFRNLNLDGMAFGPGKDVNVNIGSWVHGISCSDGYFSAIVTLGGALYTPFTFQQYALPPGSPDTDGDGIPDSKDLCQNTIPNATVDANGCPSPADQADLDNDGDVDPDDFNVFKSLRTGPTIPTTDPRGDFNGDQSVDQLDFAEFQLRYTGMNIPYNPRS